MISNTDSMLLIYSTEHMRVKAYNEGDRSDGFSRRAFRGVAPTPTPRRRCVNMKVRKLVLALTIATLAILAATTAYLLRDPLPDFQERRSALSTVVEGATSTDRGYELRQVRLTATSGLSVELTVRRAPEDSGRRLPLVIILGGHHTGRDAVRLLGDTRGTLVAAMSYPFAGDPRPDAITFLREIPAIRRAFRDTPPAIMLSLDHLLRRRDVDTSRVEVVGVRR